MTGTLDHAGHTRESADSRIPGKDLPRSGQSVAGGVAPSLKTSDADRRLAGLSERISERLGRDTYARYFDGQVSLRIGADRLEVVAPTAFKANVISRRFGTLLREVATDDAGFQSVVVVSSDRADGAVAAPTQPARPTPAAPAGRNASRVSVVHRPVSQLPPNKYRLENFIVGESNRLAYDAAMRVAEGDWQDDIVGQPASKARAWGPLFLHGSCGMGKTHLLQGIAARFKERRPGAVVRCVTGESFTNEYLASLHGAQTGDGPRQTKSGPVERFRQAYRRVDLLCIDDVHFLANKSATQGELLHTFDALDLSGATIVLASDEHPRQVKRFSEALVSRFMSGMVARIDAPDRQLCERLVRTFAERRGMLLDESIVRALSARVSKLTTDGRSGAATAAPGLSIREIEGLITRIEAYARLHPDAPSDAADAPGTTRRIGMVVARRALGAVEAQAILGEDADAPLGREAAWESAGSRAAGQGGRLVRLDAIVSVTCRALGVEWSDFAGRGRSPRVVLARSIVGVLARRLTPMSFPEIARGMGRPSHSSVIAACQRLTRQIEQSQMAGLAVGADDVTLGELCDRLAGDVLKSAARA